MTSSKNIDTTEEPPTERKLELQHMTIAEDTLKVQVEQPNTSTATVRINTYPPEVRVQGANGDEAVIHLTDESLELDDVSQY